MKKIAVILLVVVVFLPFSVKARVGVVPPPAPALSGGPGGRTSGEEMGNSAYVLYTAPRAFERLKDPLAVRQSSILHCPKNVVGRTLLELFMTSFEGAWHQPKIPKEELLALAARYEVLQVVRVYKDKEGDPTCCVIWFVFIEKDKLIPLSELPPAKNREQTK